MCKVTCDLIIAKFSGFPPVLMLFNVSERCQLEGAPLLPRPSGPGDPALAWSSHCSSPSPPSGPSCACILGPHPPCPIYSCYVCCHFTCHNPPPKLCISNSLWVSPLQCRAFTQSQVCPQPRWGQSGPAHLSHLFWSPFTLTVPRLHPQSPLNSPPPSSHAQPSFAGSPARISFVVRADTALVTLNVNWVSCLSPKLTHRALPCDAGAGAPHTHFSVSQGLPVRLRQCEFKNSSNVEGWWGGGEEEGLALSPLHAVSLSSLLAMAFTPAAEVGCCLQLCCLWFCTFGPA